MERGWEQADLITGTTRTPGRRVRHRVTLAGETGGTALTLFNSAKHCMCSCCVPVAPGSCKFGQAIISVSE